MTSNQNMQAAVRRKYGLPKNIRLEEITIPTPQENQIVVKVLATTVNRTDCANLTAKPFIMRFVLGLLKPRQPVLGTDFAGRIISVGKSVRSLKAGDRVFGFKDTGAASQAEYLTFAAKDVHLIPQHIGIKQAAASLEGAHYAYSFVHKTNIQLGQKVLINGATGGIGSALLQFVRQYDVEITATCATQHMALIQSLGADKVIDYTQTNFTDTNTSYDFIFDSVGKSTYGRCKPLLTKKGVYISSELGPYAQNLFYSITTALFNGKKVVFPIPFNTQQTIPFVIKQLENRCFNPVIDKEYTLAEINQAYAYVMLGEKVGNVVIRISND